MAFSMNDLIECADPTWSERLSDVDCVAIERSAFAGIVISEGFGTLTSDEPLEELETACKASIEASSRDEASQAKVDLAIAESLRSADSAALLKRDFDGDLEHALTESLSESMVDIASMDDLHERLNRLRGPASATPTSGVLVNTDFQTEKNL